MRESRSGIVSDCPIRNSIFTGETVIPEYRSPFTAAREPLNYIDGVLKIHLSHIDRLYRMGLKPNGTLVSGLKVAGFNRAEILYALDRVKYVYNQLF